MKTSELAELLGTTSTKITDKNRSTNMITSVICKSLLEMPLEVAKPYIEKVMADYLKNEDKINARRETTLERVREYNKKK